MKTSILILFVFLTGLFSFTRPSEVITTSFKVNGECGMCKKKIETALRIKGIKKVNWDVETHVLSVTFNEENITLDEIHKRIAAVGYDTEKIKATDEAYNGLHTCCKYDRSKI